jgi:5'(3')-deoxyribonucleotidase
MYHMRTWLSKKMDTVKETLIELVRARPVLYTKGHNNFEDSRTVKRNNWDDIAKELASEHPDVCSNWAGKNYLGF